MTTSTIPLPHQSETPFITDGGLETTLVFHEKLDLPCFAAFTLMETEDGRETLRRYFHDYAQLSRNHEAGFILESPTWRSNPDWGRELGYNESGLARINRESIGMMHTLREQYETPSSPFVISGCIGPRGDGYVTGHTMSAQEAADYHRAQIRIFRDAGADIATAITMTYAEEALGVVQAAAEVQLPAVISFTLETDGRLPSGQTLGEAIELVDSQAATAPAYYMINCAHPTHFWDTLQSGGDWRNRIGGVRANASRRSHEELDSSPDLDDGNPTELAQQYRELQSLLPNLQVYGGCCGTDHRHLEAICSACVPAPTA